MFEAGISSCRPSTKILNKMGNFGSTLTSNIASSFGQGIGGIFGSAISAGADLLGQHFQRKHEKEMQERQAEINREAYDHEFETEAAYNNPVAERARLEAAGLNPALMYGQGVGGSSVSASMTSQGSGSSSAGSTSIGRTTPAGNPLAGSQIQASMAQVKQSTAQASAYDAQAQKTFSEIADSTPIEEGKPASPGQLAYQAMLLSNDEKKYGNTLRQLDIEVRNATKGAEKAMAFERLRALRAQIFRDDNVAQATIDHFNSLVDLHGEQAKDLRITRPSRIAKMDAETKTEETKQSLNESLQRLNNANAWSKEFENFKWQNNGTIKPGMNVLQGVMALIADLPSNISKTFKDIQSIGNYIDEKFFNLKDIIIKDVDSFIKDVNFIATSTNKLDSFLRILEKNVGKFADNK